MDSIVKIFGAKAAIQIRYEGDLQSLAAKLSSGLMLVNFQISQSEYPPHDTVGAIEALGWEISLERHADKLFQYSLRMETEHSVNESFNNQMHDLSPWLARYVSSICGLESLIAGTQIVFKGGKPMMLG